MTSIDIYNIIDKIYERPNRYLFERKISALWNYLRGYQNALCDLKIHQKDLPNFDYFSTWICGRINTNYDLSVGWYWHLLKYYNDDEEKAFLEFFNFLIEFRKAQPIIKCHQILESKKKFYFNSNKDIPAFINTKKIFILNLPPSKSHWVIFADKNNIQLSVDRYSSQKQAKLGILFNFDIDDNWKEVSQKTSQVVYENFNK